MKSNAFDHLLGEIIQGVSPTWVYGLTSPAKAFGVALAWRRRKGCFVFLCQKFSQAENIYRDLKTFLPQEKQLFLLPFSTKDSPQDRLRILYQIKEKNSLLLIATLQTFLDEVPSFQSLTDNVLHIGQGGKIGRNGLRDWLSKAGYEFSPLVGETGDCSVRGGIVDLYCPLYPHPWRVEFCGETIESIREFDSQTQRSIKPMNKRKQIMICPAEEESLRQQGKAHFSSLLNLLPPDPLFFLDEPFLLEQDARKKLSTVRESWREVLRKEIVFLSTLPQNIPWMKPKITLPVKAFSLNSYRGHLGLLTEDLKKWTEQQQRVIILSPNSGQADRLQEILGDKGLRIEREEKVNLLETAPALLITTGDLSRGFVFRETGNVFVTDEDIFQRYRERRKRWVTLPEEKKIARWTELKPGNYVVHIDHGIGKFKGVKTLQLEGKKSDYFQVDYKGTDRLYIPIDQLDRLHKYIGDTDHPPPIHSLEGGLWRWTKRRARKATKDLAVSLLKHYSIRKVSSGYTFEPDNQWQLEFEASFPYQETPHQLRATQEIKQRMENPVPMDQLVCGDAGYGKTEVAMRASFKAVMNNKQVAVLVPTTILGEQHYRTFKERMVAYPIKIELLSRFQTSQKQKEIIRDLKRGLVDIVIGTHRLLQNDVGFKALGLIIIDEEQKFGVIQKKKFREFHHTVDVLSLTATPIPRSLHMALTGVSEMSVITSPPEERQNVQTRVIEYDQEIIKKAIYRELEREGQIFYLHNRIETIYRVTERIQQFVPEANIIIAHGRISSSKLETIMKDFLSKKYDILVCTTIIESGIDMPNVNTLIVENSEQFGLADLYQLRGRVGRGKRQGYAYFCFSHGKTLTEEAQKRLQVIRQFEGSGAGFRIALQDLQIRGAGNLLGKEQHGHIVAVGFTFYTQLLSEEIKKLKGEKVTPSFPVNLDLKVEARLPQSYIPYLEQRFAIYAQIGKIKTEREIWELKEELRDRYGPLPRQVRNLLDCLRIKLIAKELGIVSLAKKEDKIWLSFSPFHLLTAERKRTIEEKLFGQMTTLPLDEKNLILKVKYEEGKFLIYLRQILQEYKNVLS